MYKNVLCAAVAAVASIVSLCAQTRTVEHEYAEFESLSVSGDFQVTLVKDNTYATKLVVEDVLEGYVQCYVKSKTLYVTVDEKSIPKDIKKSFKGKDVDGPVLKVTVYVPGLNSIELSSDCTLNSEFDLNCDSFELKMGDNSVLNNLNLDAKGTVKIASSKKANIGSIKIKAKKVEVNSSGSSVVTGQVEADRLSVTSSGSSEVSITGKIDDVNLELSNTSKNLLTGSGSVLNVSGKGSTPKVDASGFAVNSASIDVAGVSVTLAAKDKIELNLEKGAEVTYTGDPQIKIVKILNSSVLRQ